MDFLASSAFWSVVSIWFWAVMTPGADTFLVVRSSVSEGRRSAYAASLGIVAGTIVWLAVGFFFVQVLSKTMFFEVVRMLGGCYLVFMAWQISRSLKVQNRNILDIDESPRTTDHKNFLYGLLTNLSNPKPPIFISIILSKLPQTLPLTNSLLLLCVMAMTSMIWFYFVVRMLSVEKFFKLFMKYSKVIDAVVMCIFGIFGLSLIFEGITSMLE